MTQSKDRPKLRNALQINRTRCILAIIGCSIVCVSVFLGVVTLMLSDPDMWVSEVGAKAFRMFTVLSNMLMAVAAAMCIPFAVEGLRHRNYHLPRWVVYFLFAATTGVALTFIFTVTALSIVAGYRRMMVDREGIYLHTIAPICSILLFLFINSDHKVPLRTTFLAVLPMFLYSVAYAVLAFAIGEEAGGWRDHYQFNRYIPWYVAAPFMYLLVFGVADVLRILHNRIHQGRKADLERYYQESEEFAYPTIEEAVRALAENDRTRDLGGEITVPRRIVNMMERKYKSGLSVRELLDIYLEAYLKTEIKEDTQDE